MEDSSWLSEFLLWELNPKGKEYCGLVKAKQNLDANHVLIYLSAISLKFPKQIRYMQHVEETRGR